MSPAGHRRCRRHRQPSHRPCVPANPPSTQPTHPPRYLAQGVEAVLKWSLANHKHALHVRRQTIIVTLQVRVEGRGGGFGRGADAVGAQATMVVGLVDLVGTRSG